MNYLDTKIGRLVFEDITSRRKKKVTNHLLNWWWERYPEAYMEFHTEGIKGEHLLADLCNEYPNACEVMLKDNWKYIAKEYQSTPRIMNREVDWFRS